MSKTPPMWHASPLFNVVLNLAMRIDTLDFLQPDEHPQVGVLRLGSKYFISPCHSLSMILCWWCPETPMQLRLHDSPPPGYEHLLLATLSVQHVSTASDKIATQHWAGESSPLASATG